MSQEPKQVQHVVVVKRKSVGIAVLLTLLFGPFGLLYGTVWGGLIMLILVLPVGLALSSGAQGTYFVLMWLVCTAWAVVGVGVHNRKLPEKASNPKGATANHPTRAPVADPELEIIEEETEPKIPLRCAKCGLDKEVPRTKFGDRRGTIKVKCPKCKEPITVILGN